MRCRKVIAILISFSLCFQDVMLLAAPRKRNSSSRKQAPAKGGTSKKGSGSIRAAYRAGGVAGNVEAYSGVPETTADTVSTSASVSSEPSAEALELERLRLENSKLQLQNSNLIKENATVSSALGTAQDKATSLEVQALQNMVEQKRSAIENSQNQAALSLQQKYFSAKDEARKSCSGMADLFTQLEKKLGVSIGASALSAIGSGASLAIAGVDAYKHKKAADEKQAMKDDVKNFAAQRSAERQAGQTQNSSVEKSNIMKAQGGISNAVQGDSRFTAPVAKEHKCVNGAWSDTGYPCSQGGNDGAVYNNSQTTFKSTTDGDLYQCTKDPNSVACKRAQAASAPGAADSKPDVAVDSKSDVAKDSATDTNAQKSEQFAAQKVNGDKSDEAKSGAEVSDAKSEPDAMEKLQKSEPNVAQPKTPVGRKLTVTDVSRIGTGAIAAASSVVATVDINKAREIIGQIIGKVQACRASVNALSSVVEELEANDTVEEFEPIIEEGNKIVKTCNAINPDKLAEVEKKINASTVVADVGTAVGVAGQIAGIVGTISAVSNKENKLQGAKAQTALSTAKNLGDAAMAASGAVNAILSGTTGKSLRSIVSQVGSCEGLLVN